MSLRAGSQPAHMQRHERGICCGALDALQKVAVLPAPGGRTSRKRRLAPSMVIAVLASPNGRNMVSVTLTCCGSDREAHVHIRLLSV